MLHRQCDGSTENSVVVILVIYYSHLTHFLPLSSDSCICTLNVRTGEIMYGGHITDAWDRRTCNSYLSVLMNDQLFAGLELGPGFASPNPAELDYEGYITYVEDKLPQGVMKILWLLLFMFAFLSACLCLCLCLSMCLSTCMCIFLSIHVCSGSMSV